MHVNTVGVCVTWILSCTWSIKKTRTHSSHNLWWTVRQVELLGSKPVCRQFPSFPYLWLNSLGTGGSSWVFAPAWHRLTQVLNRHRFHFTMSKQFQIRGRNLIVGGKARRRVWNGKADGLVRRKGSHQTIETQEAACFLSFFFFLLLLFFFIWGKIVPCLWPIWTPVEHDSHQRTSSSSH